MGRGHWGTDSRIGNRGTVPLPQLVGSFSVLPKDFLADDEQKIYYASDYVSSQLPGMEAAALSGLDAARHVVSVMSTKRS